ncbi:hypothetical protein PPC_3517 [Pseudomonas protegens Cab57]|uniref:hypothetical protein n=1 Tax=Pseudomonas protegens TaxID=380021 RepID=UPI0004423DA7|nr:hypothetical protein [Pseudomonas protegens]BAO62864.1 hypothetical protein PPC_3517 [Pseudomonas protegens Cab57]
MLNDYGKSLFKPWCSVQNVVLSLAFVYVTGFAIKTYGLSNSEVASWVQAFGSIAAIIVAAYFPILHARKALEARQQSLAEILGVLADDAVESLHLLAGAFYCPVREKREMMKYETFHRNRDWQALIDQLSQIPVAELTPSLAKDLSYLKDAVGFGALVASKIPEWMKAGGHSQPDVIRVLRAKRDFVGLIRTRLPSVGGKPLTQGQMRSKAFETNKPPIEPLAFDDAEIYRRYYWKDFRDSIPNRVYIHGIYPYLNDFGPSLLEIPDLGGGFKEIDEYVCSYCLHLHKEHLESEMMRLSDGAL